MAESHVMSALVKKRSEILGEIQHCEALIKEYKENLSSLDATIHIFDSNYDLQSIKSKKVQRTRYFETGEAKVLILDLLRQSVSPIRTDLIAKALADKKGLEEYHHRTLNKSIITVLGRLEKNGLVERAAKEGLQILWRIRRN